MTPTIEAGLGRLVRHPDRHRRHQAGRRQLAAGHHDRPHLHRRHLLADARRPDPRHHDRRRRVHARPARASCRACRSVPSSTSATASTATPSTARSAPARSTWSSPWTSSRTTRPAPRRPAPRTPSSSPSSAPPATWSAPIPAAGDQPQRVVGAVRRHRRTQLDQRPRLPRGPVHPDQRLRDRPDLGQRRRAPAPRLRRPPGRPRVAGAAGQQQRLAATPSPARWPPAATPSTILAGSVTDTSGTSNQVESEQFTVVTPTSGISNPANEPGRLDRRLQQPRLDRRHLRRRRPREHPRQPGRVHADQLHREHDRRWWASPVRVSGDKYRYFFTGHYSGDLQFAWIAGSFAPAAGASVITPSVETASAADVLARTWIDLSYQSGAGAGRRRHGDRQRARHGRRAHRRRCEPGRRHHVPLPVHRGPGRRHRHGRPCSTAAGPTWTATWAAAASARSGWSPRRSRSTSRSPAACCSNAPGVDEPLVDLSANVTLEIDTARKLFTLTFDGQLKLIKLGTVGATSGRFVLDMGDGTSSHPRLLGRRDPRDELQVAGAVRPVPLGQGHAADQHDERRARPRC